jgi:uncharacterized protein YndB with AHSA1/START domain
MTPADQDSQDVEVGITIAAAPEAVFAYFSNPAAFQRWMGPGSTIDAKPGGEIRVAYPNGDVAAGRIESYDPGRRIAFSWGYERDANGIPLGSTHVDVELTRVEGGTRVVLRHTGLANAAQRRGHRAGWRFYLAALSSAATSSLDATTESLVDDYVSAWSEIDPERRRETLRRIWDPAGVFNDAMGYAEGVEDLDDHIAMSQAYAPKMRLVRSGPIRRSHGSIAYDWQIAGEGDVVVMSGFNTADLSPDGRLRRVTGYWNM